MSKELQIWTKEEEKAVQVMYTKKQENTINHFQNEFDLNVNELLSDKKFMKEIYDELAQIRESTMLENISSLKADVLERAFYIKVYQQMYGAMDNMDEVISKLTSKNKVLEIENKEYKSLLTTHKIDPKSIDENVRIHREKLEKSKEIIGFNRRKTVKEMMQRTNERMQELLMK